MCDLTLFRAIQRVSTSKRAFFNTTQTSREFLSSFHIIYQFSILRIKHGNKHKEKNKFLYILGSVLGEEKNEKRNHIRVSLH